MVERGALDAETEVQVLETEQSMECFYCHKEIKNYLEDGEQMGYFLVHAHKECINKNHPLGKSRPQKVKMIIGP